MAKRKGETHPRTWSLQRARAIAGRLGAIRVRKVRGGNEFMLDGERVSIRCARRGEVGIKLGMLGRVELVIGAFRDDDGTFDVWSLEREDYEAEICRIVDRKRGTADDREGWVTLDSFEKLGKYLGNMGNLLT